ncbi:MAG: hypothetical protein MUO27_03315 [Sedimentisphaerales bacterium]|nr:hypothetical protein [Sedimentisphaerales bacterium]
MDERELYKLVCEERFDDLQKTTKEILGVLKGTNDKAGLCERVRKVEERQEVIWSGFKKVIGGFIALLTIVLSQFVIWFREKWGG